LNAQGVVGLRPRPNVVGSALREGSEVGLLTEAHDPSKLVVVALGCEVVVVVVVLVPLELVEVGGGVGVLNIHFSALSEGVVERPQHVLVSAIIVSVLGNGRVERLVLQVRSVPVEVSVPLGRQRGREGRRTLG